MNPWSKTFLIGGFVEPQALLWLLVVPVAAAILWFSARRKSRLLRLLGRAIVCALFIFALSRPRHVDRVENLGVAFLLDVSKSVPVLQRDAAKAKLERWFENVPPNDQASLVLFAERPSVEVPFGKLRGRSSDAGLGARLDRLESRVVPQQTDIQRALEFVEGTFPAGCARRIVLLSDGNSTRGDLAAAARALRAAQVQLDVVPINYKFTDEVVVEGLHGPGRARIDEPLALRAVISSQSSTRAEVQLLLGGQAVGAPLSIVLNEGTNTVRFSPRLSDRGYKEFEVVVRAERDGNSANNVGRAGVLVEGEPKVLVVGKADWEDQISSVLAEAGIRTESIPPHKLPTHPGGYIDADAIVLNNVAAFDLDETQMTAIRDAVRELGVGLIVVGGHESFGPGGYRGTVIEDLLPVNLDTTNKKTFPRGALVVVLHSIEFDSGNTWAVRIAKSAMQGLQNDDEVGILLYDGMKAESWLFPLTPMSRREELYKLIDACQPGDMMTFETCFQLASVAFNSTSAAVKHIVVISDGDPASPSPALVQSLVDRRVTVSTICIEPHGPLGSRPMADLAKAGGGRFRELVPSRGELEELPKLMLKETATLRRAAFVEKEFAPIVLLPNSPILRGMDGASPTLHGYVITSKKDGAETILMANAEDEDPLLATWRTGLGKVTAFTSDATTRWGKNWVKWDGFGRFWQQAVRATMPDADAPGGTGEVRTDGDGLLLAYDVRDDDDIPVTGARVRAKVMGRGGEPIELEMNQDEPGHYVARAKGLLPGHYIVRFQADLAGKEQHAIEVAAIDFSPEDRSLRSSDQALRDAALLTGGKVLGEKDDPFRRDFNVVTAERELWPLILAGAVILLVLEVAQRRFELGFGKIAAALQKRFFERAPEGKRPPPPILRPAPLNAGTTNVPADRKDADPGYRPTASEDKVLLPRPEGATAEAQKTEADHLEALRKAKEKAQRRREWQ